MQPSSHVRQYVSEMSNQSILTVSNLSVAYRRDRDWLTAVRDVSFNVAAGQTVGLVGESGSGKSTIALAIMRYLGKNGRVTQGNIDFMGRDLVTGSDADLRDLWGNHIALVPQDPLSSLNPSIRVGEQVAEILRQHENMSQNAANARVRDLLSMVKLPDPERVARSYPHQISGGMQQRVMIAMALSTEPKLLVMDEPTTALDVTTEAAILDLIRDLIRERDTAVLYVTHDFGVVGRICDRVLVLYAGDLVEEGTASAIYHRPNHPYTRGLLASVPQLGQSKIGFQLQSMPGQIPALGERPEGCVFAPRCPVAVDSCATWPDLATSANGDSRVRCHRRDEIGDGSLAVDYSAEMVYAEGNRHTDRDTILTADNVAVHFPVTRTMKQVLRRDKPDLVKAVDGVSIRVESGRTLGLVGESGSGKTTLARTVVGLTGRSSGEMVLLGSELPTGLKGRDLETLREIKYVFQNPEETLNPYLTIGESLRRPLMRLRSLSRREADAEVARLLESVRLSADYATRYPRQLSGGEKQRVAIARAFATNPALLIGDEAVSALDVSVQASILNLLNGLQAEHGNAILFISHDLSVVSYLADDIAVMYLGHVVEFSSAEMLLQPPHHPYTEALLSAIPNPDPDQEQTAILLSGDVPSAINVPSGCPFHTRCPRYLGDICREEMPPWRDSAEGTRIRCHIPLNELRSEQL